MATLAPTIFITPQEANALSILAGVRPGATSAQGTFDRLREKGWLAGESALKVATAMVDESGVPSLSDPEKGILENYRNWAARNRKYSQARFKKAHNARSKRFGPG